MSALGIDMNIWMYMYNDMYIHIYMYMQNTDLDMYRYARRYVYDDVCMCAFVHLPIAGFNCHQIIMLNDFNEFPSAFSNHLLVSNLLLFYFPLG